jgi:predicted dehydrogenase
LKTIERTENKIRASRYAARSETNLHTPSTTHPIMKIRLSFLLVCFSLFSMLQAQNNPLKIGVIGLSHTHVHWIFNSEERGEISIVGIVEPNEDLAARYARQYDFPLSKIYASNEELISNAQPDAVTAFGNIYDHLSVVQFFAPKGIHIMVEKPLAVSLEHARQMAELARKHKVQLLTNYETTWYPTNHKAYELLQQDSIGKIKKIIVRDGHRGPKKIGVDPEFLEWLTDPQLNGAGALMDFGCYGANLMTWLMKGERPLTVTAITHQLQEENNPRVDDEAIIIIKYKEAIGIIQPSWNWPIGRKDMEIHGEKGVIFSDNRNSLRVRMAEGYDGFEEYAETLQEFDTPLDDPFAYLAAVIRGNIKATTYDLSSLDNNLLVMEILQAAMESAQIAKTVKID